MDYLKKYLSEELLDLISSKTYPTKNHVVETQAGSKMRLKDIIDNLYLPSKSKSNPLVEDTKRRIIVVDGKFASNYSDPFYYSHNT